MICGGRDHESKVAGGRPRREGEGIHWKENEEMDFV